MTYFRNMGISDNVLERLLWSLTHLGSFLFSWTVHSFKNDASKTWISLVKITQAPPKMQATERTTVPIWKASQWTAVILTVIFIVIFWPPSRWFIFQEIWSLPLKDIFTATYIHICCLLEEEDIIIHCVGIGMLITHMRWLFLIMQHNNVRQH